MFRDVLALPLGVATLWATAGAYVAANGAAPTDVSFTGQELAVLGAICATLIGGLSFMFRQLMKAKDEHVANLEKRIEALQARADKLTDTNEVMLKKLLAGPG
mgnify:CR=1 FL=1